MKIFPFGQFTYGTITKLPPNQIPNGAASDSLNWLTIKGKLELVRGYQIFGTTVNSQSRCSGLRVGKTFAGVNVMYATYDQKLRFYRDDIGDFTEIGSDLLPVAAKGEDISLEILETVAGKQLWMNSPNTGPYKFNIANPGAAISMYDSSKNYKGWIRFFDNRCYLWNIDNFDRTTVRLSYIEDRGRSDFGSSNGGQVTGETVASGGILAQKGSNAKVSVFDIAGTGGAETFTDDLNGNLVGTAGGTGTINYQTAVISFTPVAGAVANLTAVSYRYVDETSTWTTPAGATQGGVANFLVPTTRIAGSPNVYQQGHGGNLMDIVNLNNHHFCLHERAVYDIVQSQDDITSTNQLYRETLGIKRMRGAYSAPEGIYSVDTTDPANQRFVLIGYSAKTTDIKPLNISPNLDLANYYFDKTAVFPFGDYVHFSCRSVDSPDNNRTFIYHRVYKTWDILDYCISCADIYNGSLVAGDSLSPNIQQLYSGWDANGDTITNFWKSGISRLGYLSPRGTPRILYGQKKAKKLYLEGYIMPDQVLHIYASLDRGAFVEILDSSGNPFISGNGSYIDSSQSITIGSDILGDHSIGGETPNNLVQANHYARYLDLGLDRFEEIQIMLQATGLGYVSVIRMEFRDIRVKQNKPSLKYRG